MFLIAQTNHLPDIGHVAVSGDRIQAAVTFSCLGKVILSIDWSFLGQLSFAYKK